MARSTVQRQFSSDLAYYRRELKSVTREATAQDKVRVIRMVIDHEMFIGRQRVHARLRFAQSLSRTRHPLLQRMGDWLHILSQIYLTVDVFRIRQVPEAVKGCFYSIAEIWKAIQRRGQALPVDQKSRKTRRVIGVGSRAKTTPGHCVAREREHQETRAFP